MPASVCHQEGDSGGREGAKEGVGAQASHSLGRWAGRMMRSSEQRWPQQTVPSFFVREWPETLLDLYAGAHVQSVSTLANVSAEAGNIRIHIEWRRK